ncbi:MAG TPA: Hansenula MRAKII killer toxin-resistant protein 1, partial [Actinoplanes sp.]|nr:Hansenula MRAKII killer toxin-resistant protein 1 [Actinoplanes sp.]
LGAGAATSGVAGPLLVAFAFLALAPRLTGALGPIESAYLIAPYAVLAGLAGSALAVTTGRFRADRRASRTPAASRPGSSGRALPGPARSAPDTAATSPNAAVAPPSPDAAVAPPSPDAAVAAPRTRAPSAGLSEVPATGVATPDDRAKRSRSGGTSRTKLFGRSKVPAQPAGSAEAPAAESARPARPATDPEIAAAVRPSRPRPKKAAPAPEAPKKPRSTVTPPPATPAIAQINPAPPAKS